MIEELQKQLMAWIGLIGVCAAGVVGIITKHTTPEDGINWKRTINETPVAMFSGLLAAGIGAYVGIPLVAQFALATALAHLGPKFISFTISAILAAKFGDKDGKN